MRVIGDWGSSHLRCYLLSDEGELMEKIHLEEGIKKLGGDKPRFARVLKDVLSNWKLPTDTPVQLSGMVSSKSGWMELPYMELPLDLNKLNQGWASLPDHPSVRIMTGVKQLDASGAADVMRGEEIQIAGVKKMHPEATKICLPGTHSKWASLVDDTVTRFKTHMTGDLFQALVSQSIFSQQVGSKVFHEPSFLAGNQLANDGCGLEDLFTLRTDYLFNRVDIDGFYSYLSGFLIANELKSEALDGEVHLCGSDSLMDAYALALKLRSIHCIKVPSELATITGHLHCA